MVMRFADGYSRDEEKSYPAYAGRWRSALPIFDIVNGFLIDAVAHCIDRKVGMYAALTDENIWLRLSSAPIGCDRVYASLSLMVWILKREVRAFGGCLGMYRR